MNNILKTLISPLFTKTRHDRTPGEIIYKPDWVSIEEWNSGYSNRMWDYLYQLGELARYSVIVGYCQYFKSTAKVLDIGCGEGILQERLGIHWYSKYVGIDISGTAIERAIKKQNEKTFFIREDATQYTPNERFDIIIFNECLFYFEDPLKLVKRYESFLNHQGVIIISIFVNDSYMMVWRILEEEYSFVDETRVSNQAGLSWIIKAFTKQ